MKRYLVLLCVAACSAFGTSDDDTDAPKNVPLADGGPGGTTDGGPGTVDHEGGIVPPEGDGGPGEGGAIRDSGPLGQGALVLRQLAEWHAPNTTQFKIPIPSPRANGDLLVAVVNQDAASTPGEILLPGWNTSATATTALMRTTVLTRVIDSTDTNEVLVSASVAANTAVLVALYQGASGISVTTKAHQDASGITISTAARPTGAATDMYFLVTAGVVASGEISFGVPNGFLTPNPKTYAMTSHHGFGANAAVGATTGSGGFVSTVSRDNSGAMYDAVSTLILVQD